MLPYGPHGCGRPPSPASSRTRRAALRRSPGDGRDRHGSQVAGNRLRCRPGARRCTGGRTGEVPVHLRNAYYPGAKVLGHGQGYLYPYGSEHGLVTQHDLPGRALGT
ncbi:hypothetical protein ACIQPR_45205 [Streptomyces sp. NPDC091280]|uniref:AAA family ATPase n=1 Tax=Streptomyces sp. NPDC091280 TaxID=3365984 RepID=UPI0038075B25